MSQELNLIYQKYYITTRTDTSGVITDVSEAFCNICGYTKEELLGQSHSIIRHPDTPKEFFKDLWKTISSGKKWTGIIKNRKKDGTAYWVDSVIEPIFDENGMVLGYYSLRFDITSQYELKVANNNLEKSLNRFRELFANINSGIAIIDKQGNFIDVNPYLCNLFGYTKKEFLCMNCFDASKEHDLEYLESLLSDIFNGVIREKTIQKECGRKNGNKIWIEATYTYFDENSILVSINNIENLKKLEKTTSLLVSQSRDAAMGEMLSMIAHQWRQPLATLSTITSKMKIKQDLDMYSKDAFDTDFKKITSIIMHLSKTIEYFRNYFKPKVVIKENIHEILESLVTIVEPLAYKNAVKLNFEHDKNKILLDSRIDQVLLNIYKNSIEACYEKNQKGKIITKIEDLNDLISIKIFDDAGGIPNEIIGKIFEPYFSTKNKNGTGLGLYMSKDIVENILGGKLKVENTSEGACFIIEIKKEKSND